MAASLSGEALPEVFQRFAVLWQLGRDLPAARHPALDLASRQMVGGLGAGQGAVRAECDCLGV